MIPVITVISTIHTTHSQKFKNMKSDLIISDTSCRLSPALNKFAYQKMNHLRRRFLYKCPNSGGHSIHKLGSGLQSQLPRKLVDIFGKAMLTAVCILIVGAAAQVMGSAEVGDLQGRVKRQAAPPKQIQWLEILQCCPFPMILTDESKTGCFTQPPLSPGGLLMPNPANQKCDVECAYKKQGLASVSGVDTSALGARVAELAASTPAWASVISDALTSCTKNNPPVIQAGSECKTGAGEMSQCLNGHMILNCPAAVVDPSPKCTEVLNGYRAFKSG